MKKILLGKIVMACMRDQFLSLACGTIDEYDATDVVDTQWLREIDCSIQECYLDATTLIALRRSIVEALEYLVAKREDE